MAHPLQYYRNVTVNTVNLIECMEETGVEQVRSMGQAKRQTEVDCMHCGCAPCPGMLHQLVLHLGRARMHACACRRPMPC